MPGNVKDRLIPIIRQRCKAMAVTATGHQQFWDLHVIPQHQLLRIRIQIYLLVHPLRHRVAVQVMLEQCERHDQRH